MPDSVLPYGGVFVVQLDQSKGFLSLYHLCNSEIIFRGAAFLLKNMPYFVASIGRGCSTMRMKESLSKLRRSHLTFLCAALHISSRTSAIGFIHPYKVVREVYRKSGDFVLTYGKRIFDDEVLSGKKYANPYRQDSICKPYIFHRADLVNTEIIITTTLKSLILLPDSVVTYGRQFIHCCSLHRSINDLYSFMGRSCAILQSFQNWLSFCLLFPFTLWRGSF